MRKVTPQINIKKISTNAVIPTRGSEQAAGYDLYACWDGDNNEIVISPGETIKIGSGVALDIDVEKSSRFSALGKCGTWNNLQITTIPYFGAIFARSGLATKNGLRPANCVGVIDPDYRGEIIVPLHNDSSEEQIIHRGDRIAQLVFIPYFAPELIEVDELSETERGEGGFGSTGTN